MTDSVKSFSAMLRTALGDRIAPDADSFLDMMADDGVMEFPFFATRTFHQTGRQGGHCAAPWGTLAT